MIGFYSCPLGLLAIDSYQSKRRASLADPSSFFYFFQNKIGTAEIAVFIEVFT
jgi:hypothetical protein